jgi:hypothetical protein
VKNWTGEELELRQQVEQGLTVVCNSTKTKGLHINLMKWAKDNGKFTYIGRKIQYHKEYTTDSKWCNKPPAEIRHDNAAAVDYFINEIYNKRPDLQAAIGELKGQVLGCWCKPLLCHGDFLAEQANNLKGGAGMPPGRS